MNGSGNIIDQDIKVSGFNSINIRGPFALEITPSDTYKVTLSIDDNLINRIQISTERKILTVRIEAPATFFPTSLKLKIALPAISSLNLAEGVKAAIADFPNTADLTLFLSAGSSLTGSLDAAIARLNLSDASQVTLQGKLTRLELDSSGASKMDMGEIILVNARVNLKESSEATINVDINGKCDVVLASASKLFYLGNPLFSNTSITGGSTMVHK